MQFYVEGTGALTSGCVPCCSKRNLSFNSLNREPNNLYATKYREEHKEEISAWGKEYYKDNKSDFIARNAKRHAAKLQRTVSWANLSKIKDIYSKCPTGYHVDHIIPLQGELVSGLHVENNLQYLTASENMIKGNKFICS